MFRIILLCLCLPACTSLPKPQELDMSFAPSQEYPGFLGYFMDPHEQEHPGMSGLAMIRRADAALRVRLAMADLSEHSLDLQYYIWHGDRAGHTLLLKLLDASERGVRVRLLLDDHTMTGKEFMLARLDALPNFNVKLYNPYSRRKSGSFARTLAFLGDFSRLNQRMHNKVMIADNQLAITGGRNIGNEYFGLSDDRNFHDMDLFATGPVVTELSDSFDEYWNSNWAISVGDFEELDMQDINSAMLMAGIRADIELLLEEQEALPYDIGYDMEDLQRELEQLPDALIWGLSLAATDPPRKEQDEEMEVDSVNSWLGWLTSEAQEEILWSAPYFVPSDRMIEGIARIKARGVDLKILTNSLASNDVGVAHYGYANRREEVVAAGVDLYEFRPDAEAGYAQLPAHFEDVALGLHAKVAVFDRRYVYIGSSNLDPRSIVHNTEIGLVVDNPDLADGVAKWMLYSMEGHSAYRIVLEDGELCWQWQEQHVIWRECDEPDVSFWDALGIWVVDILPIENQL